MDKPHWNKELWTNMGDALTVGKLKEILADLPDDDHIIINCPTCISDEGEVLDREAKDIGYVDTHWHGAVTFTEN